MTEKLQPESLLPPLSETARDLIETYESRLAGGQSEDSDAMVILSEKIRKQLAFDRNEWIAKKLNERKE
jgi:hypothetical protein